MVEKMEIRQIANKLQISEAAVEMLLTRARRKLVAAGEAKNFAALVLATQLKSGERSRIRCGSIECRPEKWIYYA
jgi:DNA-binding transcriptional regulator LsrR (DeoR family)